jgi:hypothetical protein
MTVAVDARNNSLIVTAPEPLYLQVLDLVESIDQMAAETSDDVSVVTLSGGTNAELVQQALSSILGTTQSGSRSRTSQSRSGSPSGGPSGGYRPPTGGGANPADIQQRIEMFRRMRESGAFGGGGRPTGAPSGFSRGGSTGGRPTSGFSRGGSSGRQPSGGFGGRGFGGSGPSSGGARPSTGGSSRRGGR